MLIAELDQPGHINDLEAILDEVERLRQLTDRLGLINRPLIDPTVQPVDLAPLAAQALEQVRQRAVLRGIDLDYHGSAEVWAPLCPELILLLLAQLLDNGLDACQAGDAVGLSIDKVDGALTVRIEDSGAGMAPEILQRATEPFFTTKDAHAGMGLTLTREVVERVHGVLTLCSSPNTGTQVVLRLPV